MKVLVCGGRDYADTAKVTQVLDRIFREKGISQIIQGGARGADSLAAGWARRNAITNVTFLANWEAHGRSAGVKRNVRMLNEGKPDLVVAFPGGRGTAHMVSIAKRARVEVECISG